MLLLQWFGRCFKEGGAKILFDSVVLLQMSLTPMGPSGGLSDLRIAMFDYP